MKLLWLTVAPLDSPGFRATQFGMAIALEKLGWEVDFMGKTNKNKPFEGFNGFSGRVSLIQRKGKLSTELNYHFSLWRVLRKKYDVVMFEPPQLRLIMVPAILSRLKIMRAQFMLDVRTPLVDDGLNSYTHRFNYWLAMKFAKWCSPGVSLITQELKQDLKPLLGEKKPVVIWGSGVDPELFNPSKVKAVSPGSLGINKGFIFFYHGTLSLTRGLPELILAMKKLHLGHPEAALVLLGDGQAKHELKKQTRKLHLEDVVFFIGKICNKDVPKYIAMADVGVIPLPDKRYWQVSSPLKLFEYMAMQLPLVVSDIVAHRSVLGDAPFAVYAREVSPEGLYEALKVSISRISELKKNTYLARELTINKHAWIKQAPELSAFLDQMFHGELNKCPR